MFLLLLFKLFILKSFMIGQPTKDLHSPSPNRGNLQHLKRAGEGGMEFPINFLNQGNVEVSWDLMENQVQLLDVCETVADAASELCQTLYIFSGHPGFSCSNTQPIRDGFMGKKSRSNNILFPLFFWVQIWQCENVVTI